MTNITKEKGEKRIDGKKNDSSLIINNMMIREMNHFFLLVSDLLIFGSTYSFSSSDKEYLFF